VAEEGMEIVTSNERIDKYRRMIVELLFAERNHICAVCVANGHCDLQAMAQKLGVTHIEFDYLYTLHSRWMLLIRNMKLIINRCILCGRCVRVCDEIEGAHTRDFRNRGINTLVLTDFATPWVSLKHAQAAANVFMYVPPELWLKGENRS
jgi:bidirectional [NiFe] hydrogenase diaphorase subunit